MTFSLIKKLETELAQLKGDLLGFKQEMNSLNGAIEKIEADYQYSLNKVRERNSDIKGSIAFCESAIDQYENALTQLERDEAYYVNGQ